MICRHMDDNKLNFHVDNLAWGTHKDNSDDARRNGRLGAARRRKVGKWYGTSVLSEKRREIIRLARITGISVRYLAAHFGISPSVILAIEKRLPTDHDSGATPTKPCPPRPVSFLPPPSRSRNRFIREIAEQA
jgi:hypothetical protein